MTPSEIADRLLASVLTSALTAQEIAERLLDRDPLPPLVPAQVYDAALTSAIMSLTVSPLAKAGLHLLNDDLTASHTLVQSMQGDSLADYWHAIIHRREGDYGNAHYWFGRVGREPILAQIYGADPEAPAAFVERCRTIGHGRDADLEKFQREEMALLLTHVLSHRA